MQMDRVVAFRSQALQVYTQHMLRAGGNAQLAAFTENIVDLNPTLDGHRKTSL
jgi:hypothetical protein